MDPATADVDDSDWAVAVRHTVKTSPGKEPDSPFQPTPELWDEVLRERAEFERLRDGDTEEA